MSKNVFGATIPKNVSLKTDSPLVTPAKSVVVKNSTPKPSGGGSSKKTTPSFFSSTEQAKAVQRVADVLNPFSNAPIPLVNPITGNIVNNDVGGAVRSVVRVAEVGSLAYGVSLIPAAGAGLTGISSKATSMLPASLDTSKSLLLGLNLLGLGALGGYGLASFGKPAPQVIDQTPVVDTSATIPISQGSGDVSPYIKGDKYAGRDLFDYSYTNQSTYPTTNNYASPTVSQIPTQNTSADQAQNTGTNWGLIALIGAGAYLFLRNN